MWGLLTHSHEPQTVNARAAHKSMHADDVQSFRHDVESGAADAVEVHAAPRLPPLLQ